MIKRNIRRRREVSGSQSGQPVRLEEEGWRCKFLKIKSKEREEYDYSMRE